MPFLCLSTFPLSVCLFAADRGTERTHGKSPGLPPENIKEKETGEEERERERILGVFCLLFSSIPLLYFPYSYSSPPFIFQSLLLWSPSPPLPPFFLVFSFPWISMTLVACSPSLLPHPHPYFTLSLPLFQSRSSKFEVRVSRSSCPLSLVPFMGFDFTCSPKKRMREPTLAQVFFTLPT